MEKEAVVTVERVRPEELPHRSGARLRGDPRHMLAKTSESPENTENCHNCC